ncbi:MAG: hypothetical protein K2K17_07800, partial [Lachnospiraceae bacterium]|nr:hypothetical protein [Lachnospiraceae bacterium]
GGLSLTSSGFGFWSHDIGGFESTSTADVYKRWCAFGLLSTHSRLHGSHSYRVPWLYDEEAVEVVRRFTKLKASLMPYLYRNAVETSLTGVPMMRSMVLEYPEDKNCAYLATQYFLGDSLLVAPIFNEQSMAEYYLPEGTWISLLTDEVKEGGKWYREVMDYMTIPLYVKAGSIIAVGDGSYGPVYDYAKNVMFKVYALKEGTTAKTCIYSTSAEKVLELEISHKESGNYRITLQSDQTEAVPCSINMVGVKGEVSVTSGENNDHMQDIHISQEAEGTLLSFSHIGIYDITVIRQE